MAQKPPEPDAASPRQLYVACTLMLTGNELADREFAGKFKPMSAPACLFAAMNTLKLGMGQDAQDAFRFCPNGNLDFDSNAPRAMARAYLEYFESSAENLREISGLAAFVIAQKTRWPCR
ncbi:hypothetical protein [Erythrobacter litoralis]|uniref:hypothetical protein n=1 Tax=Erythrobacter litoralis TaxID=39960 RepID=UPI001F2AC5C1|nr:hypothetical protein [Erythrobacter litoralis]